MFKIVTAGWNAVPYVKTCVESVVSQTFADWQMCVILDKCTDESFAMAKKAAAKAKDKIMVFENEDHKFGMENQIECIRRMRPELDDILVWLDADDWLARTDALQIVSDYYQANPDIVMSHGSWESYPPEPNGWNNSRTYFPHDWKDNIRCTDWRASHLRTMKYKLFRAIRDVDLRGPDGKYLTTAIDCAVMWPALEMAGYHRVQFIPEVIHTYNRETVNADWKVRASEQSQIAEYVRSLPPYKYRESLDPQQASKEQMITYLRAHEREVAKGEQNFGNLKGVFKKLIGRVAGG